MSLSDLQAASSLDHLYKLASCLALQTNKPTVAGEVWTQGEQHYDGGWKHHT